MKRATAIFMAFLFTYAVTVFFIQPSNAAQNKASAIQSFVLENGLEIVVIPDRRAPVVTHMIWYRVGAADEPRGKSGIAHFLEHLMFKGTSNYPAGEFTARISAIGGRENAFTSSDYTAYYQKIIPQALEMVMRYEADRMVNLVLDDAAVLPERDVVLEERSQRVGTNPRAILGEAMGAALYRNHPYGIPIIGWEHEIAALSRQDALAFYKAHYRPGNAILVVAGDVEAQNVLKLARETYGKIAGTGIKKLRERPSEPDYFTARTVTHIDERVTTPLFSRSYLVPSYRTAETGEAEALDLLAAILGGASTSRIKRDMLVDTPLAASAGAYYRGGAYDMAEFSIYVTPLPEHDLGEAQLRLDNIIGEIVENGVSPDELADAKDYLIKSIIFERDSQTDMARLYGSALASGGTIDDVEQWPERIRAVTVEQVNNAARKYLDIKRSVTGYLRPEDKS
jgi:zinc protease